MDCTPQMWISFKYIMPWYSVFCFINIISLKNTTKMHMLQLSKCSRSWLINPNVLSDFTNSTCKYFAHNSEASRIPELLFDNANGVLLVILCGNMQEEWMVTAAESIGHGFINSYIVTRSTYQWLLSYEKSHFWLAVNFEREFWDIQNSYVPFWK